MKRIALPLFSCCLLCMAAAPPVLGKEEKQQWQPIPADELALKDCPGFSGCPAMILLREEVIDERLGTVDEFYRIKIFKPEGDPWADVEIPFVKDIAFVRDIQARTIAPDGKAAEFSGDIYEKTIIAKGGDAILEKAFALPVMGSGTIIEYKYKIWWPKAATAFWLHAVDPLAELRESWIVQHDLFTRRARFAMRPGDEGGKMAWTWQGLPADKKPVAANNEIKMEIENVPPLQSEEYMPPSAAVESRVWFFHVSTFAKGFTTDSSDWYWKDLGKVWGRAVEDLIGDPDSVEKTARETFQEGDSPEIKLRKLYSMVQGMRNLDYEHSKTRKEYQRENLKESPLAYYVLKNGYGDTFDLTRLFVALARSAGFDSNVVAVVRRDYMFFQPTIWSANQFKTYIAEVQDGSTTYYLDPALPLCPFGTLPWELADTRGIRLEKKQGTLITLPAAQSNDAGTSRKAKLQLQENGNLQGEVEVTFQGPEALRRRLENRETDAAAKRKSLEDDLKAGLPLGSTVELKNSPDWTKPDTSLTATFSVVIPQFATRTGHRLLVSPAVLHTRERYPFQTGTRAYDISVPYPFQELDDVTIVPPPGFSIETLPPQQMEKTDFGTYEVTCENQSGTLHSRRRLAVERTLIPIRLYSALRVFFDDARAGDEQEAVLQSEHVAQDR